MCIYRLTFVYPRFAFAPMHAAIAGDKVAACTALAWSGKSRSTALPSQLYTHTGLGSLPPQGCFYIRCNSYLSLQVFLPQGQRWWWCLSRLGSLYPVCATVLWWSILPRGRIGIHLHQDTQQVICRPR